MAGIYETCTYPSIIQIFSYRRDIDWFSLNFATKIELQNFTIVFHNMTGKCATDKLNFFGYNNFSEQNEWRNVVFWSCIEIYVRSHNDCSYSRKRFQNVQKIATVSNHYERCKQFVVVHFFFSRFYISKCRSKIFKYFKK